MSDLFCNLITPINFSPSQTNKKMKQISLLMLVMVALIAAKCQDHQNPALPDLKVVTTLSGSNEVPARQTSASGSVSGTLNQNTRVLSFAVNFSGLTPVAGHIHKGAAGTNGPVIIPFHSVASSPIIHEVTLTEEQVADLKANLHYVNLHTAAYPGGEIRGQLSIVP